MSLYLFNLVGIRGRSHWLTLVTRDTRHLTGFGADLLNPFERGAQPAGASGTSSPR
jgi:hypothetical protein